MATEKTETKKRILTSYEKLTDELLELFMQTYPSGYGDAVVPITKPNGGSIYVVRLETEDVSYLVRVEVKIDEGGEYEEEENENYESENESLEAAEQFPEDKDEDDNDFD